MAGMDLVVDVGVGVDPMSAVMSEEGASHLVSRGISEGEC